jgi:hypothetical protein
MVAPGLTQFKDIILQLSLDVDNYISDLRKHFNWTNDNLIKSTAIHRRNINPSSQNK